MKSLRYLAFIGTLCLYCSALITKVWWVNDNHITYYLRKSDLYQKAIDHIAVLENIHSESTHFRNSDNVDNGNSITQKQACPEGFGLRVSL